MFYYAVINRDENGISVKIPDLPGFCANIETQDRDSAIVTATQTLSRYGAEMKENGEELPQPSDFQKFIEMMGGLEEATKAEALLPLHIFNTSGATQRINISVDSYALAEIDKAAELRNLSRSAFLVHAARELINTEGS